MLFISIENSRFLLRDFTEADRTVFFAYQMDPRYLALYDFSADDVDRPNDLFDLFRTWSEVEPRRSFQLGLFDTRNGKLCGCAGLRMRTDIEAVLGVELAPAEWGRFALALDATAALIDYGFNELGLARIIGDTASGNERVAKLARWFGATVVAEREGPEWMRARGFNEVDWALDRKTWKGVPHRSRRSLKTARF